jgi:hypothetical protein
MIKPSTLILSDRIVAAVAGFLYVHVHSIREIGRISILHSTVASSRLASLDEWILSSTHAHLTFAIIASGQAQRLGFTD